HGEILCASLFSGANFIDTAPRGAYLALRRKIDCCTRAIIVRHPTSQTFLNNNAHGGRLSAGGPSFLTDRFDADAPTYVTRHLPKGDPNEADTLQLGSCCICRRTARAAWRGRRSRR